MENLKVVKKDGSFAYKNKLSMEDRKAFMQKEIVVIHMESLKFLNSEGSFQPLSTRLKIKTWVEQEIRIKNQKLDYSNEELMVLKEILFSIARRKFDYSNL